MKQYPPPSLRCAPLFLFFSSSNAQHSIPSLAFLANGSPELQRACCISVCHSHATASFILAQQATNENRHVFKTRSVLKCSVCPESRGFRLNKTALTCMYIQFLMTPIKHQIEFSILEMGSGVYNRNRLPLFHLSSSLTRPLVFFLSQ